MTKTILIALTAALAGCADDEPTKDPKSEVTCGASWTADGDNGTPCDAACDPKPAQNEGQCETNVTVTNLGTGLNEPLVTATSFTASDGTRGTCTRINPVTSMIMDGVDNEPSRTRRVFFLTCKETK